MHSSWMMALVLALAMPAVAGLLNQAELRRCLRRDRPEGTLNPVQLLTMMGFFVAGAPLSEWFFDSLYRHFAGHLLWQYNILPLAGGSTSWISIVIWACYGANVTLIYSRLNRLQRLGFLKSRAGKSLIMGCEGPAMEIVFNLIFLLLFQKYIAYYLPNDAFHLTSLQVIPVYAWCGWWVAYWWDSLVKYANWRVASVAWGSAGVAMSALAYMT